MNTEAATTTPAMPRMIGVTETPEEIARQADEILQAAIEGRLHELGIVGEVFSPPKLTHEEFRQLLDEMAAMGMGDAPPLPLDFCTADAYEDDY